MLKLVSKFIARFPQIKMIIGPRTHSFHDLQPACQRACAFGVLVIVARRK